MDLFDYFGVGFSAGQWPVGGGVEYSAMAAVEVLLEQQLGGISIVPG
jgi:alpha/beta superfamily hydrolase